MKKKSRLSESQQNGYVRFLASVDSFRLVLLFHDRSAHAQDLFYL